MPSCSAPRPTGSPSPSTGKPLPANLGPTLTGGAFSKGSAGSVAYRAEEARRWISAGHYASTSPTVRAEDITTIVPTRNEIRNIPAFLGSIPPDIRLIVVDASSDDTPRCIGEMRPNNTVVLRYPGIIYPHSSVGLSLGLRNTNILARLHGYKIDAFVELRASRGGYVQG